MVGMKAKALYNEKWYTIRIVSKHAHKELFKIQYKDGGVELRVPANRLRPREQDSESEEEEEEEDGEGVTASAVAAAVDMDAAVDVDAAATLSLAKSATAVHDTPMLDEKQGQKKQQQPQHAWG